MTNLATIEFKSVPRALLALLRLRGRDPLPSSLLATLELRCCCDL
jgi:hypothetical protein